MRGAAHIGVEADALEQQIGTHGCVLATAAWGDIHAQLIAIDGDRDNTRRLDRQLSAGSQSGELFGNRMRHTMAHDFPVRAQMAQKTPALDQVKALPLCLRDRSHCIDHGAPVRRVSCMCTQLAQPSRRFDLSFSAAIKLAAAG